MGDSDSDSDTSDLVVTTPEKENPNRTMLGKMNVSLLKKNTDGLNSLIKQSSIRSHKTVLPELQDESLDYGETNGHAGNNCNIDSSVSEGSQNDETIRPIVDEIFNKKTLKSVESQDLTCTSMSNAKTSVSEMSLKHNYIKEDTIQPQTSTKSDKYRNSKATIDSSDCDEFVIETSSPKSESCTHKSYHLGHDSKNDSSIVASNIRRKYRHGKNIIVSDSEDSEKEDRSPNKTSEKETFDSSRYRDKDLITVSSDSEESGKSEDEASISDSSDFETAVDMSGIKIGAPVESTSVKENSFHSKVTERTGSELPKVVEIDVSSENKPQPKDKETSMNRTSIEDSSIQIISDTPNIGKVKQVASQSTVSTKAENSRDSFSPTLFSTPNKQVPIKRDPVDDLQQTLQLAAITEEKSLPHPLSSVQDDNKKKQAAFAENIKPSAPQSNVQDMVKKKEMKNEMLALSKEIDRFKGILRTVNLATLADRGTRIHMAMNEKELKLKKLREQWVIHNMDSVPDVMESSWKPNPPVIPQKKPAETATGGSSGAVPKKTEFLGAMPSTAGMGKQAFETHMAEKAMTVDALKHLHSSLKECPGENVTAEDPKALKSSVVLMEHQKRALAWLMWRESYKPYGGILADDMGLGKTLTMIALVLKAKEERENNEADKEEDSDEEDGSWYSKKRKYEKGGTLVVCPASLINQWEGEVKRRVRRGVLDVEVYHGQSRETKPRRLAKRDIVITTYNIVRTEGGVSGKAGNAADPSKQGCLFGVKWERVILDEGHTIRNHKSQTSVAACALKARHRWALTGTPMHNKELDLYSLLKFLRCSPFDEYVVWRKWIDNKSAGGMQRLNTVMNSLMLRRTKEQLQNAGALSCLPTKEICEIVVKLDKEEFEVYQTVLNFSRTLFAQFLAQKVEKEQLLEVKYGQSNQPTYMQKGRADFPYEMTPELKALHQKMNNIGDIKSFHILVLLLRLRQICCHPALIESMLDEDVCKGDGIEDEAGVDIDLLSQMQNMGLEDKNAAESVDADGEVKKKVLVSSNPVFKKDRVSSKMRLLFQELQDKVISRGDNAVIVSQFTSMLELIRKHLKSYGIKCMVLTGAVPVKDRMALVEDFNTPSEGSKVMLLSLTAGGVGLNLIGGNHLLLMDPHWNPQLEAQAFDRIYRVGQKKAVHIYKFLSDETIEQQIKMLQIKKMSLATSVLTGSKHHQASKLSMEDLKTLFQLK